MKGYVTTKGIDFSTNSLLTSFNVPALTTVGSNGIVCSQDVLLPAINFPSLNALNGSLNIYYNTILTNLSFPVLTTTISSSSFNAYYNNFSSATVNAFLVKFNTIGATAPSNIALQGQSPAAPPTGAGITAKAALIALGKSVITD